MTERIIKVGKNFELLAKVERYDDNLNSLELFQHWPEALRPHWRRITQLNLSRGELLALAGLLTEAAYAES